ncbi:MAG: porin [Burkholderiaceae bacterium]
MKKTLIAVAALAATASFAQVTLTGNIDISYHQISGSATTDTTALSGVGASVGSSTTAINIASVEDLGGGMKATAFLGLDPRAMINSNGTSAPNGALGRHEAYVGVMGGFGGIYLGPKNSATLDTWGARSPLGTATGAGFANIQTAAGGLVRADQSVQYVSPTFNGITAKITNAPGNTDAVTGITYAGLTDIGVSYANGPLVVAVSSLKRDSVVANAGTAAAAGVPGVAATSAAADSTYNSYALNYAMGAAKLFIGGGKSTGALVSSQKAMGASYSAGTWTFIGQYGTLELSGNGIDRKNTGLRIDNALSKRTVAYVAYEAYDTGAGTATTKTNTAAIGVRHSF